MSRHTRWDSLVAVTLGAILLGAGWVDTRAFLRRQGRRTELASFAFMADRGGTRMGMTEFFNSTGNAVARLDNVGQIEHDPKNPDRRFRHALGPVSAIELWSAWSRGRLKFRLYNAVEGQDLTVACNGRVLAQFTGQREGTITGDYPLELDPNATNRITLTFARYNGAGVTLTTTDDRKLAGTFRSLELFLE